MCGIRESPASQSGGGGRRKEEKEEEEGKEGGKRTEKEASLVLHNPLLSDYLALEASLPSALFCIL